MLGSKRLPKKIQVHVAREIFMPARGAFVSLGLNGRSIAKRRDEETRGYDGVAPLDLGSDVAYYFQLRCISNRRGTPRTAPRPADGGTETFRRWGASFTAPSSGVLRDGRSSVPRAAMHDSCEVPSGDVCKAGISL